MTTQLSDYTLIVGTKNKSSWSLRPWLAMKVAKIPFKEVIIELDKPGYVEEIAKINPAGRVPALLHQGHLIWDSLSICEYIAEEVPNLWPHDKKARAWARSISNEMHSGFAALRNALSMNIWGENLPSVRTAEVEKDIRRIQQSWLACRSTFQGEGPFLFGQFTIADAMYAPVVSRFRSYNVEVPDALNRNYMTTIWNMPEMQAWITDSSK